MLKQKVARLIIECNPSVTRGSWRANPPVMSCTSSGLLLAEVAGASWLAVENP